MIKTANPLEPAPSIADVALRFDGVTKSFRAGKRTVVALEDLNVSVAPGKITGLIGPDGAGKTTLMRLTAGILRADSGTVNVLGLDASHQALQIQASVGYMPQRFGLYEDLTVQENLDLYADLQGVAIRLRATRYEELMRMTGLDPAPLSMVETIINLKPPGEWRDGLSHDELIAEMDNLLRKNQIGFTNSWTMPTKGRIDMLSTGIRTPIGIKIHGADLEEINKIGQQLERALSPGAVEGTRSVYAERVSEGYYLDFDVDRKAIARHGLTVGDVHEVIQSAVGGMNVTMTVEGRERYPVNVRYGRDFRSDLTKLRRVLVGTKHGAQVPLEELATIEMTSGPGMIKSEGGQLVGYVYVDIVDRDPGSYVADAKKVVNEKLIVPAGYYLEWSGAFESMERAKKRLMYVIPFTLLVIMVLLYFNTRSIVKLFIVLLAVPFSLVGAFLLLHFLGYHLSVAVWVGIIALAGVDAETGVVMLLYLDVAFHKSKDEGRLNSKDDVEEAILEGAVQRVRPKMMTVLAILLGLLPIMWSSGAGADVMKRIAAPMVGGVVTSFILELLIYPAVYYIWKSWTEVKHLPRSSPNPESPT